MEELRKGYEGLGLNDSQMLVAKSVGITKEQMIQFKIACCQMAADIDRMMIAIVNIFSPIVKDHADEIKKLMSEFNKSQVEFIAEPIKSKKGKKLKCWENKRFYQ